MFNMTPYARKHQMENYNPFRDFEEMERNFWGDNALAAFKTDIKDNGTAYELAADLPGFKKEDIKLDIEDNTLTISAERHSEYEEKDKQGQYVKCERSYGSYSRSFDVSQIKQDEIKANYTDGVLKLTLPKQEEARPSARRLAIE